MLKIQEHIIIKDNFFTGDVLKKIQTEISHLNFSNRDTTVNDDSKSIYQKIYFNVPLDKKHFAVEEVTKNLKNYLSAPICFFESNYFLSTKHTEATPHADTCNVNCIVYIKGNELINSGTGFYDKRENEYILNLHVGFKENRAIIFDSKIYHASLQFNKNAGSRYIMANFFNYGDNNEDTFI
jgi:hypothetical protein